MKTVKSLECSMDARRKQAAKTARALTASLNNGDPSEIAISDERKMVAELTQCFHEFNAYRNALVTE